MRPQTLERKTSVNFEFEIPGQARLRNGACGHAMGVEIWTTVRR